MTETSETAALRAEIERLRRLIAQAGLGDGADTPVSAGRAKGQDLDGALAAARAEAAAHEERLRLTLMAAEVGTFDYDAATGALAWDDACRSLFGLPAGVPVTYEDSFLAGLHPEDREAADAAVRQAVSPDGPGIFDIEYRTLGLGDGIERWVAAKGRMIDLADGAARFFGIVRDVTRKHRAEAALRETEERYRLASRATNDAIWDWDLVNDQVLWNEALSEAYGHPLAEVETTGGWWLAHIHPEDRARVSHGIHAVIDGSGERWTDEYRFLRRDGGYASVQDRGFVLRDAHGRAVRMVGAMLDLSERRRAEDQQRLLMNELQHRVKNTLSLVQAIASQTFRDSSSPEARAAFTNRVIALSQANDVLTRAGWAAAPIRDVVTGATIPHCAGPERFTIEGPAIEVAARAALALTLALHELCTNAAKYGALSNEAGQVSIAWEVEAGATFRLRWAERGGPPVRKPDRTGFGTRLIQRSLGPQLGGAIHAAYEPHGLTWTFEVPLAAVQDVPAAA